MKKHGIWSKIYLFEMKIVSDQSNENLIDLYFEKNVCTTYIMIE